MRIPLNSTPQAAQLRIDERNYVLKPLLDQLSGLGRAIIDNEKEAASA